MKNFWESNFSEDKPNISWKDLKPLIHMVANKIDVIVVNRIKGVSERLNYDEYPNGRVVIAVGGYSLSRGLTLKGLISSVGLLFGISFYLVLYLMILISILCLAVLLETPEESSKKLHKT